MASNIPQQAARRARSNAMAASNREFNALLNQVLERLDDVNKKIDAMLPRELYAVQHRQVEDDVADLAVRTSATEKAIAELNSRVATTALAATQQISSSTVDVRQQISDTRVEMVDKVYDLVKNGLFIIGGAVFSYLLWHH